MIMTDAAHTVTTITTKTAIPPNPAAIPFLSQVDEVEEGKAVIVGLAEGEEVETDEAVGSDASKVVERVKGATN